MQRMVSGEEESATNEDVGAHAEGADLVEDEGERVHDRVRAGGALGGRRAHTAKVVARGARGVHGHGARHRVGVGAHPLREPVRRKHMEGVCAGVVAGRTAGRSVAKEKREGEENADSTEKASVGVLGEKGNGGRCSQKVWFS